jgi:hypothetical protein
MNAETPEPLWREVVGDTEPWRRGRWFLVVFAVLQLASQIWVIGTALLGGFIEWALGFGLGATLFWLTFYFIWIGVHWVRWVSAGLSGLVAFAKLVWGIRDGSGLLVLDGTISFAISAYLGLAPAVYFFAVRQKERIQWKETFAVAAVFLVLLGSLATAMLGLGFYKVQIDARAREFADRAFRRIFVDGDTQWLRAHATERFVQEHGWDRMSWFMTDRYMRIGIPEDLSQAQGRLQFVYRFPLSLAVFGRMSCEATGAEGRVRMHLLLVHPGDEWQIDAVWWKYTYGD